MATGWAGSASITSCCSITVSLWPACFFISGLFVRGSLARRRSENFLGWRAWRLGVPFFVSIFILMPVAYYPTFLRYHLPGTMDFNFLHFWWHLLTIGPWPSGSAWFLWVLLVLDANRLLWRNPAYGLHAPQWAGRLQLAAALVAHGLRSRLCDVQRGDDVHGPCGFLAL
jgi:hypothetical protein